MADEKTFFLKIVGDEQHPNYLKDMGVDPDHAVVGDHFAFELTAIDPANREAQFKMVKIPRV